MIIIIINELDDLSGGHNMILPLAELADERRDKCGELCAILN